MSQPLVDVTHPVLACCHAELEASGKREEAGGKEECDSWSDGSGMAAASGT